MKLEEHLEKVVDLDYLSLHASSTLSLFLDVWKRQPSQEEIRTGLTIITGQMLECNCRFKLADFRRVVNMDAQNQQWFAEHLVPALRFARVEKVARVVSDRPSSFQAAMKLADLTNQNPLLKGKTEHRVFLDIGEALAWLGI